jgi:hypothetical protein
VPEQLRKRTLAVRGFDSSGMMTGREIVEGTNVEAAIERQFANVEAEYLHIHFAAAGCYALRASTASHKPITFALGHRSRIAVPVESVLMYRRPLAKADVAETFSEAERTS